MNKTALKKSILFVLAFVLLIVYIVQLCTNGRTKVSTLNVKKEIDYITIDRQDSFIWLEKVDGKWLVSSSDAPDLKYSTEEYSAQAIVDSISSLHLLGTVSGGQSNRTQRYGLDDESKITVTAYGNKKVLRSLAVGKNSSAGSQSYVQVDGKKSIMVADSALNTVFNKSLPSLREKKLYSISSDSISSVRVKNYKGEYELEYDLVTGSQIYDEEESGNVLTKASQSRWVISKNTISEEEMFLDQGAVGTWVVALSTFDVSQWCEKDVEQPIGEPFIEVEIGVGGMIYSVYMYGDENSDKYVCQSNQSKGLFYVTKYGAENYAKNLEDLCIKADGPSLLELQNQLE